MYGSTSGDSRAQTSRESDDYVVVCESKSEASPLLEPTPRADVRSSVFNLCNTIVGAGVLGLPSAFKSGGLYLSCFLLTLVTLVMGWSLSALVDCCRISKRASYQALAEEAYGTKMVVAVDTCVLIQGFGTSVAYVVIVGDLVPSVLGLCVGEGSFLQNRIFVITLITWLMMFPLSLVRNLYSLRYASGAAMAAVAYMTIMIISKSFILDREGTYRGFENDLDIMTAIPVISFSLCCQFNIFPIIRELHEPSTKRLHRINNTSLLICSVIYILVGCFGYLTFYDDVESNVLDSYRDDDVAAAIGRVLVAFVLVFSYPLICFSARDSLHRLYYQDIPMTFKIRATLTLFITVLVYLIAIFVPDVEIVFRLVGSSVTSMIAFVFPGLFHLRLAAAEPQSRVSRSIDMVMVAFGCFVAVVGTFTAISSVFT
eukprot:TRINITY_DN18886_c0_g1_i1.p1 TRINITY_DN18886_c0_g1~~TRINITY_DN18886_c0_g1_i1.p1  ORF type:complete len:428 (+),score=62.35 TRINITY_DN18886_c0_g1_i1:78-1361(+)